MPIKLIVGLGNPGKKYEKTRHNVGLRVAEALRKDSSLPAEVIFEPQSTFMMNEHGPFVREAVKYRNLRAEDVLVILDDFSIPLETLRFRLNGSSGGHNGLDSIIQAFHPEEVPRLRIGIGPVPEGQDPKDFVLERFTKDEEAAVQSKIIPRVVEAVRFAYSEGLETAMNKFNGPLEKKTAS